MLSADPDQLSYAPSFPKNQLYILGLPREFHFFFKFRQKKVTYVIFYADYEYVRIFVDFPVDRARELLRLE